MRRTAALFLLLFAVYCGTIGMRAFGAADYAGDEPHYLLTARSLVDTKGLDVTKQYAEHTYSSFYPYRLRPHGKRTDRALREPHGMGFPLLIAPAWRVGGPHAVEVFLAALAALAVALAYRLALRVTPDPWAIGAAAAVGLSPPMLAYSTAVYPELAAACALAGAALLALKLDRHVSRRGAFGCFLLLGALPWLAPEFVPAGIAVGAFAVRSLLRARRRTLALGSTESALFSLALYVGLNESLFGGPTPYSAEVGGASTGAHSLGDYLERAYRLVALFLDRDYGLVRWAPVLVLAGVGLWLLYRSRRDGLARVLPEVREGERAATLCAVAIATQLAVAAFLAPTMFGFWFPARHLMAVLPLAIPLVAWGLRHVPRVGTALAVLTFAGSVWLFLAVQGGHSGLVVGRPDAPFGPLVKALPLFGSAGWTYVLAGAVGAALLAAAAWERSTAGSIAGTSGRP